MAAPTIITPVEFSGTPRVGEFINVEAATFTGSPTIETGIKISPNGSSNWQEIDLNTPGGIIVDDDLIGYYLKGYSTGTNVDGTVTSSSSVIGPIVFKELNKCKSLPVYNAQLLKVVGADSIGTEYDSEYTIEEPEKIRWSGTADAYIKSKMVRVYSGGSVDMFNETTILIPFVANIIPGCVLTITQNGNEQEYKINDCANITQDIGLPEAIRCFVVKV